MNERIRQLLKKLAANLDARSKSERMLVLAMGCAAVYMVWLLLVSDPLQAKIAEVEGRIASVNRQIAEQQADYAEKVAASEQDPNRYANERLQVVSRELEQLDTQIASLAGDLVTPSQMTEILGTLLERQAGLELINFENLEAVPLQAGVSSANQDDAEAEGQAGLDDFEREGLQGQVYEHGLVIEFQGSFFDTLRYLRFLEDITGNFFWDVMSFELIDWPNAHITLQIHTLSTERGFIGV